MYNELFHLDNLLINLVKSSASKDEGSFAHEIQVFIMRFIDVKSCSNNFINLFME